MKINKNEFVGRSYQSLLLIISLGILILSRDLKFMVSSLSFLIFGGLWELIFMERFYTKQIKLKKCNLRESIKYGLMWVHLNANCIKKYGTKLYFFDKLGTLPTFVAYLTMTLYVMIALLLYQNFSYYGLIIYAVPVITNIYSFWRNDYYILDSLKK